ncbi:MAG TPA: aminopeptidase P family protein [Nitrospirota bacterium]
MKKRPEQGRIAGLRRLMAAEGVGSLLVKRREDVRYLSGFTGSAGALLVSPGRAFLITDFRYQVQSRKETAGISIVIQKKDFYTALRDTADRARLDALWFDESSFTLEDLKKLKKLGLRAREHRDLVRELRLRKDRHELAQIRLAVRRAEESFRELKPFIKPGATERELALRLEFLMRGKGARRAAFDTIVASGGNGAMPHASVTNRRIKKGDLVTIDFGAEADGYLCDITRTLCVGRPSTTQREIHELVLKAQESAIASANIGAACRTVDAAAREVIKQAGHGKHFGHGTGHGVGLMVHEGPSVSPLSKDRVEKDMVFTVEPGVYIPGWGGVRIEDMVLATGTGARLLTTLPRDLDGLRNL